jgi:hypothetical protein
MNSKQRRRLRREKLPELINLLITKRLTGDLHPAINTKNLVAAAARNPQRIDKVMPMLTKNDWVDAADLDPRMDWVEALAKSRNEHIDAMRIRGRNITSMIIDEAHEIPAIRTPEEVPDPRNQNTYRF